MKRTTTQLNNQLTSILSEYSDAYIIISYGLDGEEITMIRAKTPLHLAALSKSLDLASLKLDTFLQDFNHEEEEEE